MGWVSRIHTRRPSGSQQFLSGTRRPKQALHYACASGSLAFIMTAHCRHCRHAAGLQLAGAVQEAADRVGRDRALAEEVEATEAASERGPEPGPDHGTSVGPLSYSQPYPSSVAPGTNAIIMSAIRGVALPTIASRLCKPMCTCRQLCPCSMQGLSAQAGEIASTC